MTSIFFQKFEFLGTAILGLTIEEGTKNKILDFGYFFWQILSFLEGSGLKSIVYSNNPSIKSEPTHRLQKVLNKIESYLKMRTYLST